MIYNTTGTPIELLNIGFPSVLEVSRTFHTLFIPCSIVTNLFTAYVIQTKSFYLRGNLKNYVIINQLLNAFLDLAISGLSQPILFLPHLLVITTGPINSILPTYFQAILCISLLFLSCSSCCNIAYYEYQTVLPYSSRWKLKKSKHVHFVCVLSNISWTLGSVVVLACGFHNQEEQKSKFQQIYPWSQLLFSHPNVYVDDFLLKGSFFAAFVFLFHIIWVPLLIGLPFASLRAAKRINSHMSIKFQQNHQIIIKTLSVQIYFSIILIAVPVACIFIILALRIQNNSIAVISTALIWVISIRPICTSILILIIWKSYRQFTLKRLCFCLMSSRKTDRAMSITSISQI